MIGRTDNNATTPLFEASQKEKQHMIESPADIKPAEGKLGVLLPGLGAVSTTFIAGVAAIRRGLSRPIGSLTQLGRIRLGMRKQGEVRFPKIKEFVPLAELEDLAFGGWDIFEDNCYEAASKAGVLDQALLDQLREDLEEIKPMKAVFSKDYVKKLDGTWVKQGKDKMELAQALMDDIARFKADNNCARLVMVWCASTEIYLEASEVHSSLERFEEGLRQSDPAIAPSMIYAYAALKSGVPFANGAPNLTVDIPAMRELARESGLCIAGKDFKTGQTLMKTILAPGLRARLLGIRGWFSTNILGNRDGEVLDDPEAFHTKEVSKLGALEHILQPELLPELYKDLYHKVRINYYPPRGDNKEGWDNIDIFGWLGYPMQIKIDFLCRDSILAAPIVLDLALLMDLGQRAGMRDIQEWLSFYFKSPLVAPEIYPEHDLFVQQLKLKNTLRYMKNEMQLTHLGIEYYD
jgi:myo-inositol-1-phosphate synthase